MTDGLVQRIWQMFNAALFTIGETPVTIVGLFRVVAIVVIAWWLSVLIRRAFARVSTHWLGISPATFYAVGRAIHYAILAIGLAVGLVTIGVDFTNIALMVSALGVGIGFGLQGLVSNFVSGMILLFEKSLKIGDFVELESGVVGEVREINFRFTRVLTPDNIDILVPNSQFVNGRVTNWTLDEANRRIHVPFGVAYGTDKERVKQAVLAAAQRVPHTLPDVPHREPQVWFVRFGDSSLDFELVVWIRPESIKRPAGVMAAYLWEIHTALGEAGIEIPFPQRDVHFRGLFGLRDEQARQWLEHTRGPGTGS